MKRHLFLAVLLSILCLSCGGPRVTILYQGSSPIPPVVIDSDTTESQSKQPSDQQDTYVMVSAIPSLEGGNRALRKRIKYPDEAIRNNIEGIVIVQFKVDTHGQPSNLIVKEGIGYGCDEAVIRAIKESQFEAGRGPDETRAEFIWMVTTEFKL